MGRDFHGTGLQPEHADLVAAARKQDVRFVRALHAKSKDVIDIGPLEAEFTTRTMRRRATHLRLRQQTFEPIEDYLRDLLAAASQHERVVHVICVVQHADNRTVHSALLTTDHTAVLAELDHWLTHDEPDPEQES